MTTPVQPLEIVSFPVEGIGAFLAAPDNATYCAAKAGLLTVTRTVAVELQSSGVSVQAFCPGFTRTEFHDTPAFATTDFDRLVPAYFWGSADDVVSASLARLGRTTVVIPRLRDRLLVYALRAGLARYPRAAQAAPIPLGGAR
jgi:short-subunit dehydrogenase